MAYPNPHRNLSVAEYLEGELKAELRHEYVAGAAYAMGGASGAHNIIAGNLFAALHRHLRCGPFRVFIADMKLRIRQAGDETYYYPDVMVVCRPDDDARYFRERPILLAQVLSESTESIDRREKRLIYPRIPSLEAYLLLEQDCPAADLYRRADAWAAVHLQASDTLTRDCLRFSLPLAEPYEGLPPSDHVPRDRAESRGGGEPCATRSPPLAAPGGDQAPSKPGSRWKARICSASGMRSPAAAARASARSRAISSRSSERPRPIRLSAISI